MQGLHGQSTNKLARTVLAGAPRMAEDTPVALEGDRHQQPKIESRQRISKPAQDLIRSVSAALID